MFPFLLQQHDRQLDPTEIVAVPYDLHRLRFYVCITAAFAIGAASTRTMTTTTTSLPHLLLLLLDLMGLTALTFVLMILCGASPYENLLHTAWASLYLSALAGFMDPTVSTTSKTNAEHSLSTRASSVLLRRLRGTGGSGANGGDQQERISAIVANSTIGVTIPFQILLLYDRGWQAQRWPIPVVLGSTVGWVFGIVFGTVWVTFFSPGERSSTRYD